MKILRAIFTQHTQGEASSAIMGVCSYIANRFHLDVLAVRIAMVGCAYFFNTSKVILAYIAVGTVLSISGNSRSQKRRKRKQRTKVSPKECTTANAESIENSNNDGAITDESHDPTPELSKASVQQLERKLTRLENRLIKLETEVTSNHLQMAREFKDLQSQQSVLS